MRRQAEVRQQEVDKPQYVGEIEVRCAAGRALVADHGQVLPSPELGIGWKTLPRYQDLRLAAAVEALGEDDIDAVGHQPH